MKDQSTFQNIIINPFYSSVDKQINFSKNFLTEKSEENNNGSGYKK
jgi:hypothetical protein